MIVNAVLILSILVFVATLLLIGVRGFRNAPESLDQLPSRLKPVNVEALLNLLDQEQDAYFAQCLSPGELRWVRRNRNIVAIEYVWRIVENAALLVRVGELAMKSPSLEISRAGEQIANSALHTRLLALKTTAHLAGGVIIPGPPMSIPMAQDYLNLNTQLFRLSKTDGRAA